MHSNLAQGPTAPAVRVAEMDQPPIQVAEAKLITGLNAGDADFQESRVLTSICYWISLKLYQVRVLMFFYLTLQSRMMFRDCHGDAKDRTDSLR